MCISGYAVVSGSPAGWGTVRCLGEETFPGADSFLHLCSYTPDED